VKEGSLNSDEQEWPSWIRDLLEGRLFSCAQPAYVHDRQQLIREDIIEVVDVYEDGREHLRRACREALVSDDPVLKDHALSCLFAVGLRDDVEFVEPLLHDPEEAIRKAAQTCLFELRKRG
jgi:hypothetical protein